MAVPAAGPPELSLRHHFAKSVAERVAVELQYQLGFPGRQAPLAQEPARQPALERPELGGSWSWAPSVPEPQGRARGQGAAPKAELGKLVSRDREGHQERSAVC